MWPAERGDLDFGLDLGTRRTRVVDVNGTVVWEEASLLARRRGRDVVAVGDAAAEWQGRGGQDVDVHSVLTGGVPEDAVRLEAYLRAMMERLTGVGRIRGGWLVGVSAPWTASARDGVRQALASVGVSRVAWADGLACAAVGAGLDIAGPSAQMVMDVGAGRSRAGVFASGMLLADRHIPVGGDECTNAIEAWLRTSYQIVVPARVADAVKLRLATVVIPLDPARMRVRGRDPATGQAREVEVGQVEAAAAIRPVVDRLRKGLRDVMARTPPDAAGDIADRGWVLAGAGGRMMGLADRLREDTELPVIVPSSPDGVVAAGLAIALKDLGSERWRGGLPTLGAGP